MAGVAEPVSLRTAARKLIVKVSELGEAITAPASVQDDDVLASLLGSGIVEPDYDPETLKRIADNSSSLNQNVQAYATNIDGQGWRIKTVVDFDGDDAWSEVKESMWLSAVRTAERGGERLDDPSVHEPEDIKVEAEIERLLKRSRLERMRLDSFLHSVNPEGSFVALRTKTRKDLEVTGNAYWEVLRSKGGDLARFVLVPPAHMRCTLLDQLPTTVEDRVPLGLTELEPIKQHRYFRRYVQCVGRRVTWFKQFGDPRVVSQHTGAVYADLAEFQAKAGKGDRLATEIIHFKIDDSGSAYGTPRWIGNLLSVLGSRAADEVNYDYFDNKAVPPLALLVSGAELTEGSVARIDSHFRDRAKGRENFHKVLIIEAVNSGDEMTPGESGVVPRLKFEKLVDAQQGDALFQKYDERNIDKIGSSFRLPRLLRGDSRDFNRATSESALKFADEQVFEPERNDFDAFMNRVILPEMRIMLVEFKSLGPRTRDLESIVDAADKLTKAAIITPNEARSIMSEVLGVELPPFDRPFARQPLPITVAGIMPEDDEAVSTRQDRLRDIMIEAQQAVDDRKGSEGQKLERAVEAARRYAGAGVEDDDATAL